MSEEDLENKKLCDGCSICCEHVALEIDTPEDKEDWDNIIWYVMHENILVFKDHDDEWFVEFKTKCKFLGPDKLCTAYSTRPQVCKDYTQDSCEGSCDEPYYDVLFKCREDVLNYLKLKGLNFY